MQVSVSGHHIDIGAALTQYVTESLTGVTTKYFAEPLETHVVFTKEKSSITVEIGIHVSRGLVIHGHGTGFEPYPAFEDALRKTDAQLQRYKNRLTSHHKRHGSEPHGMKGYEYVLAHTHDWDSDDDKEDSHHVEALKPAIVTEMAADIKTLTVGQAVMVLELGNKPVVMFKNRSSGHFNVLYRREDGQIGWIDPQDDKTCRLPTDAVA